MHVTCHSHVMINSIVATRKHTSHTRLRICLLETRITWIQSAFCKDPSLHRHRIWRQRQDAASVVSVVLEIQSTNMYCIYWTHWYADTCKFASEVTALYVYNWCFHLHWKASNMRQRHLHAQQKRQAALLFDGDNAQKLALLTHFWIWMDMRHCNINKKFHRVLLHQSWSGTSVAKPPKKKQNINQEKRFGLFWTSLRVANVISARQSFWCPSNRGIRPSFSRLIVPIRPNRPSGRYWMNQLKKSIKPVLFES